MFLATWKRMWTLHEEAKDLLLFFVRPNRAQSNAGNKEGSIDGDAGGGNDSGRPSYRKSQLVGLILGPLLFLLTLLFFNPADLSSEGIAILASTIWIATWWITEAVPIPVTSLLPLVLFPLTQ